MELIPNNNRAEEKKSPVLIAVFVLFVLAVAVVGIYFLLIKSTPVSIEAPIQTLTEEKTIVVQSDITTKAGREKLPLGFPTSIPVETDTLTQSLKTEFPERNVTQYTVTYTSNASGPELQKKYETYLANELYTLEPSSNQGEPTIGLYASKSNDTLSIIIESGQNNMTKVFLVFLDRQ